MAWKNLWLAPSLLLTSILFGASATPENLPFCDDEIPQVDLDSSRLVYVTTLNGRLAALDLDNGGQMRWDLPTGPGDLLSSSIQNLELTNKGQVVRIIPSLSGSLYQLTGQSIEAIPITAENLLSLSYKFSDDLVISGGKDTRSYGVSARTGKVIYECTMAGCKNESLANAGDDPSRNIDPVDLQQQHDYYMDDVVVVRRQTQTVRAIDPRTGVERWNFSVGNHELELLTRDDCHQNQNQVDLSDIELRVIVPEGLVCAYSKGTGAVLWQRQFDYPIVNAWRVGESGKLEKMDIFSSAQRLYEDGDDDKEEADGREAQPKKPLNPAIYVGLFRTQMYVQESEAMRRKYHEYLTHQNRDLAEMPVKSLSLPWRPVPATKTDLVALAQQQQQSGEYTEQELLNQFALMTIRNPVSTWHASKGFYLAAAEEDETSPVVCPDKSNGTASNVTGGDALAEEVTLVTLVSMWHWWKEIVVISLTSALVLNLFLNNSARLRQERISLEAPPLNVHKEIVNVERYIEIPIPAEKISTTANRTGTNSDQSKSSAPLSMVGATGNNFDSRFLSDFDMIQCLGKGGFGVVFEAQNKLDDCRYAVKRIVLPSSKDNRERVMREVKTLANCEHQNIVRFFQAWVEQPPPGWQEDQDRFWLSHQDSIMSTSIDMEGNAAATTTDGIYHERLAVSPRRGIYAELNTDECLNLDEELVRKTSFVVAAQAPKGSGLNGKVGVAKQEEEEEDEDSFIEFKYSTNDIERNEDNLLDVQEEEEDEDEDEESDSGTGPNYSYNDGSNTDSVFKHSSDGAVGNGEVDRWGRRKRKQRKYSLLDSATNGGPRQNTRMYLYIQMQLCQQESLKEWLQLTQQQDRVHKIVPIFEQIVRAVEYVHLKGLIHRDLKPSNIFFALDGTVKVGDFGLVTTDMDETGVEQAAAGDGKCPAEMLAKKHTQQVGTHLYMSPEQLNGGQYDYKVDIYSLGLILFELLVVFSTEMERIKALTSLRQGNYPAEYQSSYASEVELLKLMLSQRPQERPTTFGIRAHPPLNLSDPQYGPEYHFELPTRRKDSRSVS